MKKNLLLAALGLLMAVPASAQWTNYDTQSAIRGVFGIANAAIESSERKKEMEILARQKVEFEQSFQDAMAEAKDFESKENWEEALEKYERENDGPSILHNAEVTLADYSAYRFMRENPVFVNKKNANGVKILRVACSDRETRVEMEIEAYSANVSVYIKGSAYIKGNKGGKLGLVSVQNVTMAPAKTFIPWPYQKLRFALIFPALPEDAKEFDLIEPSTTWQFKDIKCK